MATLRVDHSKEGVPLTSVFSRTVYAMNTLLVQKGVYSPSESNFNSGNGRKSTTSQVEPSRSAGFFAGFVTSFFGILRAGLEHRSCAPISQLAQSHSHQYCSLGGCF
jgi:hypothetical protein